MPYVNPRETHGDISQTSCGARGWLAEIRKVIYTTNAIESINMSLRKVIKTRVSFPTDEAATKLFYLALNISKKWTMPIRDWKAALQGLPAMQAMRSLRNRVAFIAGKPCSHISLLATGSVLMDPTKLNTSSLPFPSKLSLF